MKKFVVYNILTVVTQIGLVGVFVTSAFLASKALGYTATGFVVAGLVLQELKYREQSKLEEKAASEFMQLIASKTGQGSC